MVNISSLYGDAMKGSPLRDVLAESAARQVAELLAALERSTRDLVEGRAEESTPDRGRWTRTVVQRIKMLSGFAAADASPMSAGARSQEPKPASASTRKTEVAEVETSAVPIAAASPTIQKSRAQI